MNRKRRASTVRRALVLSASLGTCLLVAAGGSAAGAGDITCPQDTNSFTGTAYNLIVPIDGFCGITGATITHDLVVEENAGAETSQTTIGHDAIVGENAEADLSRTTVGHDLNATGPASVMHLELATIVHDVLASRPASVQTGRNGPNSPGGPVDIGHDLVIDGSPAGAPFVFDGICSATVGHDLRMTNRSVTLGFNIGDNCAGNGRTPDTIGHDLIVTGNSALSGFFGPSALEVGGNHVGHDLVFSANSAVPGGHLEVADNTVGHDAICSSNSPAPTGDPGDGANVAGHTNGCG